MKTHTSILHSELEWKLKQHLFYLVNRLQGALNLCPPNRMSKLIISLKYSTQPFCFIRKQMEGLEILLPVTIIQDFSHLKPACPAIFFP